MRTDQCQWCKVELSAAFGFGCCDECAHELALENALLCDAETRSERGHDKIEQKAQDLYAGYLRLAVDNSDLPLYQWENQLERTQEGWRRFAEYTLTAD